MRPGAEAGFAAPKTAPMSLGVRLAWILGALGLAPLLLMLVWFFSNPQLRSGEPWWLISVVVVCVASMTVALLGAFGVANYLTRPLSVLRDELRRVRLDVSVPERLSVVPSTSGEVAEVRQVAQALIDGVHREAEARRITTAALLHDLQTPLLATEHTLMALVDDPEPAAWERVRPVLELTLLEVRKLGTQVTQVVDAYRYGAAGLRLGRMQVDAQSLVADVVATLAPVAARRSVRLRQSGEATFEGDPRALRSAVQNLVANAVAHANSEVSVESRPGQIRVADDGPGLPASLEALSHPYDVSTYETSVRQVSTGLGLSIARSVAEAHGGGLRLESSGEDGTVLVLEIGRGSA